MSSEAVRQAILTLLQDVTDIGKLHDHERYAENNKPLADLYAFAGELRGGFIRRAAFNQVSDDGGHNYVVTTTWELHYFSSFIDKKNSESAFDARIDAIAALLRENPTLDGAVDSIVTPGQSGLAMPSSQPAMFAGVLVHYAKLIIQTEHSESA